MPKTNIMNNLILQNQDSVWLMKFSQMLLCVAIVVSVSPNCDSTAPQRLNSSSFHSRANALAIAVMDVVSSHGFIAMPPLMLYYAYNRDLATNKSNRALFAYEIIRCCIGYSKSTGHSHQIP